MQLEIFVSLDSLSHSISAASIGEKIASIIRTVTGTPVEVRIDEQDSYNSIGKLGMLRTMNRGITMGREPMSLDNTPSSLYRE